MPIVLASAGFAFMEFLVILQGFLAYSNDMLTVAQMQASGIPRGLPFIWHFGMWGDLLIVSPILAWIIYRYFDDWQMHKLAISLSFGFVSAVGMSWLYTTSSMPEAHVYNHHLTGAGFVHLVYMGLAIAILSQFFIFTRNASPSSIKVIGAALTLHVFIANHMVLGLIGLVKPLVWYPARPLESRVGWATIGGVGVAMLWRALW